MKVDRRSAGGYSLAGGLLSIIATLFLLAFYALEAQQVVESGSSANAVLGKTNDLLIAVMLLLFIPVATHLARTSGQSAALLAAGLGIGGMALATIVQVLFVANAVGSEIQPVLTGIGFGLIGAWLLLVSLPSGAADLFGAFGQWAGILGGTGYLLIGALSAGVGPAATADPQMIAESPLLIAGFLVGVLLSNIAFPAWAIAAGRRWRREGT